MKKLILGLVFVIVALGLFWYFIFPNQTSIKQLPNSIKNFASSTLASVSQDVAKQVSTPPPLTSTVQNLSATLTDSGVISWTHINRQENGNLAPLSENPILDKEAAAKLADMFKQQYFEHVNPQGHGPDYLAGVYGYAYISIGENLALGNFKNDQDLLTAWMNSPGHRANILNTRYTQIGVAVGQGIYQGQKTCLAVQEFGEPASVCPIVNSNLKIQIDFFQNEVNQTGPQLTREKSQIDSENPQTQADYNTYNSQVAAYNNQVAIYNNEVDTLKLDTTTYNAEVTAYNTCAGL
jgi:uncharacterized protein YkwD